MQTGITKSQDNNFGAAILLNSCIVFASLCNHYTSNEDTFYMLLPNLALDFWITSHTLKCSSIIACYNCSTRVE